MQAVSIGRMQTRIKQFDLFMAIGQGGQTCSVKESFYRKLKTPASHKISL